MFVSADVGGTELSRADGSVLVEQFKYVENVKPIESEARSLSVPMARLAQLPY